MIIVTDQCTKEVSPVCETSLNLTTGQLMSPNFPGPYENNVQCNWLIAAPNNMIIILEIFSFDVSIVFL